MNFYVDLHFVFCARVLLLKFCEAFEAFEGMQLEGIFSGNYAEKIEKVLITTANETCRICRLANNFSVEQTTDTARYLELLFCIGNLH